MRKNSKQVKNEEEIMHCILMRKTIEREEVEVMNLFTEKVVERIVGSNSKQKLRSTRMEVEQLYESMA